MQDRYLRLVTTEFNRRTLFKGAAGAVGAASALAMGGNNLFNLGFGYAQSVLAASMGDLDILNFALGLEHLENVMYQQIVASGKLTGEAADLAKMFGSFEQAHVDALTKALTGANYANIAKQGTYKFPDFKSQTQADILTFLNTVEPVGVGAYTGAANKLTDKSLLGVAGSIVQVEARQLAITHALAGEKMPVSGALSESFTTDEVNAKVKPLIG
ncbi:MAG: ferritin-like domain-containing protein [Thermomicrobia bacterium]|nr:ferritin-like domain-containing protein [Thermomicrobia bacterium]